MTATERGAHGLVTLGSMACANATRTPPSAGEATYRRLSPTPDSFPALARSLGTMYSAEPAISPGELGTIRAPTVIVQGEYEQFITRAHAERLAALIPSARFVLLSGTSHGGPLQDPDGFHRVVSALLDR